MSDQRCDERAPLLANYILAEKPACVVQIGSQGVTLHWPDSAEHQPEMISVGSIEEAETAFAHAADEREAVAEPRVALLDLSGFDSSMEPRLGRAMRLFPGKLIVYTRSTTLPDAALFAFGFRKLDVVGLSSSDADLRWFEYRLSHYKQPPDWLNARFWANPERFDVDEDLDIYYEPDQEEE